MKAVGYLIGAGSMTLGVEAAGFDIAAVVETPGYSKNAQTWDLNRPRQKHVVQELDRNQYINASPPGYADLIFGNPPCGGMSNMTGSKVESNTNSCMVEWAHMAVRSKPKLILMENGFQLATDRMKNFRYDLFSIFANAGYYVWAWRFFSWQLGCPQTRQRCFVCASITKPTREDLINTDDLPEEWGDMSVLDYIWDLSEIVPTDGKVITETGSVTYNHYWDNLGAKISEYLPQYHYIALNTSFMTPRQRQAWEKGSDKEQADLFDRMQDGLFWYDCPDVFTSMQQFRRPHPTPVNGPAHTVLSDYRLQHPFKLRLMTLREHARLMGYPDEWKFHSNKAHLVAQGVPTFNAYWAAKRLVTMTQSNSTIETMKTPQFHPYPIRPVPPTSTVGHPGEKK